jgi:hypothetical protein
MYTGDSLPYSRGKNSGDKNVPHPDPCRMFLGIKDPDSCLFVPTDPDHPINKYKN